MDKDEHLIIEVVSSQGKPLLPETNANKFVHQCGVGEETKTEPEGELQGAHSPQTPTRRGPPLGRAGVPPG